MPVLVAQYTYQKESRTVSLFENNDGEYGEAGKQRTSG